MNTKTTPKDFFLHLAATVCLYASVIALIDLAFSAVNYALPDALAGYFYVSSIVWPISMLVVLVPLLYVFEWLIRKDINKMPEKKEVWVRRWRIYLTVFLTIATIAGTLITLINTFLNGEITARFIYKVLIILVISGVVFAYYILEKMSDSGRSRKPLTILAWIGIVLAIAGIVGGFIVVGSPATQRAVRFDEQRLNDSQAIQYQVINYWQRKQALPQTLADLNDSLGYYSVPTDPETKQPYEYSIKGMMGVRGAQSGLTFDLCANFSRESTDMSGRGAYSGYNGSMSMPMPMGGVKGTSWAHPAGHACFDRMIDAELYPPIPKSQ